MDLKSKLSQNQLNRLQDISALCKEMGLKPYLVGGIVRDLLLGLPVKGDLDITVCGGPLQVLARKLSKKWKAGIVSYPSFLTFTLGFKGGSHLDLVTARKESYPSSGSLPVVQPGTLKTDLFRRDFSVNAMAVSLENGRWGEIEDPMDGRKELERKKIRILHTKSFWDDPTRIFRAARFAARFGFDLEGKTGSCLLQAIREKNIKNISLDRVRAELEKIFLESSPSRALELLSKWGASRQVDNALIVPGQILKLLDQVRVDSKSVEFLIVLRCSLLLRNKVILEAKDFLYKLHFPKEIEKKVTQTLALYQDLSGSQPITTLPRPVLMEESSEFIDLLCLSGNEKKLKVRWKEYRRWLESKPVLNGDDLKKLGLPPGPVFKEILHKLSVARYEGHVRDRDGEIRFVIDNFRRD